MRGKIIAGLLNFSISMFWALLVFVPMSYYLYQCAGSAFIWIVGSVSVLCMALPPALFRAMQLSTKRDYYERIGVLRINLITQYGPKVNALVRKAEPGMRMQQLRSAKTIKANMEMFEKFHFGCLVMFSACMVHAMLQGQWAWALFFLLANVLFNVYPILIQQYLRIRMAKRKD